MFTSSIRSFRHALTQPAGRVGRVGRRVGAGVAAVAFCAMLPSPAAAQPTFTAPAPTPASVAAEEVEAATGLDAIPAGIAAVTSTEPSTNTSTGATQSGEGAEVLGLVAARAAQMPVLPRRVVGVAAAQTGDPYVYGASGPNAFDCSGLTSFVYRVAARRYLPHSSSAQYGATQRISRGAARPGDLVFFHSGSGIYHVGIYAGGNSIIHASKPGTPVTRAQIWTSAVSFGRVR